MTLSFRGHVEPSLEARVELSTLSEALRQELLEVLREQLGVSYTVIPQLSWRSGSYALELKLQCLPGDVQRLQQTTARVIAQLDQPGISERQHSATKRSDLNQLSSDDQGDANPFRSQAAAQRLGSMRICELGGRAGAGSD